MGFFSRFWLNPASKMLMPKKNRIAIYEHLFEEGVMVAKKDFNLPKHPELETIPNLQVIKALTSLKSRGYVKEQFAWRHYYWYLTNEGIQYLRDYLHLPPESCPPPSRGRLPERPGPGPLQHHVLVETSQRETELLTEELQVPGRLTRLAQLVQALHPWSSEEALAGASQLSKLICIFSHS